jgi:hypothetical protein
MADPVKGNAHAQFRAGAVLRSECDARMSGVPLDATHQDDFCSYTSVADVSADPRYNIAGFESNFALTTDNPWNGKQSFRILGQLGGYNLFIPTVDTTTLKNVWLRTVFRLQPGGLGPNDSELGKWVYDFGGGFYLDFVGADKTTHALRYTSNTGTPDWTPGVIEYDDGSWWEWCLHFDTTTLTNATMGVYIQHADHTGTQFSDVVTGFDGTGWMEGNLAFDFAAPSEPAPYPWLDVGAWEYSDGSANADPFHVGA